MTPSKLINKAKKNFYKTFLNVRFDTTVGTGVDIVSFLTQCIQEYNLRF